MRQTAIINLGEISIGKCLAVDKTLKAIWFDVKSVSDSINTAIIEAVEKQKEKFTRDMADVLERKGYAWSSAGVSMETNLQLYVDDNKRLQTELLVMFEDKKNSILESDVFIPIDLSQYMENLTALARTKCKFV